MKDGGNSQSGFEVVPTEFQQSRRGAGEQEGVEPALVVLNERVQFVRKREHHVKIRNGQQVLALLLQPLGAFESLATGTMAVSAGVWHEVPSPAVSTLILMATQRWCVTGGDGPENFPVMDRQTMRLGEVWKCGSYDFAQGDGLRQTSLFAKGHGSDPEVVKLSRLAPTKIDQVERATDLFQAFFANMEVDRRGREPTMTKEPLKGERIDTRL